MKDKNNSVVFYIITGVIIIITFFILQPKVLPVLFGIRNQSLLDSFIQTTKQTGSIDVRKFWEMREFYCPGAFKFDKTKEPFLTYSCKWFNSKDYLTTSSTLQLIEVSQKNILAKGKNFTIYKNGSSIIITFIASNEDMQRAVGFFDYKEKDKKLTENKNWLDFTIIHV